MSFDVNGGSDRIAGFFNGKTITMALVAGVLFVGALSSAYTVDNREIVVIDKFSELERVVEDKGLQFKIPFIEGKTIYRTDIRNFTTDSMTIKTEDGQNLNNVRFQVKYKIRPSEVQNYHVNYANYAHLLQDLVEPVAKGVIGKTNTNTIAAKRSIVETEVFDTLKERAASLYKLDVTYVGFDNLDFSPKYEAQIEKNMESKAEVERAKQNAESAKFAKDKKVTDAEADKEKKVLEAAGESESIRLKAIAKAEATRLQAIADAEATTIKGDAEASALEAKGKALDGNDNLIDLERAKRWNGKYPDTLVGSDAAATIILDGTSSDSDGKKKKKLPIPQ